MAKSLSWPLWPQALSASCLPACCRWCRHISSFWRARHSNDLRTRSRSRGSSAKPSLRRLYSYSAFPPCSLRSARARASSAPSSAPIRGRSSIIAGVVIVIMGLHFLGVTPIALSAAAETVRRCQAGRSLGRLCDRARLRLWMDAVHWTNPRGHFGSGGVRADRDERGKPARGLFARPWNSIHGRGLCDRTVRSLSVALPQLSSSRRAGHGGVAGFDRASHF